MGDINKYAIIVAGGKGTRMGGNIPKQFLPLLSMPVLCHSVQAFAHSMPNITLILVAPADMLDSSKTIIKSYLGNLKIITVAGGETRFHSVQNGLKMVKNDGIVFVHDAVRPLVSRSLINRCYNGAIENGSAIPGLPITDSVRIILENGISEPLNRDLMRTVQTPQTFRTNILLPAFSQEYHPSFTDEATVVEASGIRVHLIEGDRSNIKITSPGDMIIADTLLKNSD